MTLKREKNFNFQVFPQTASTDRMDAQFVQALYSNLGGSGISNTAALNYWLGQLQTAEATLGDAWSIVRSLS